MKNVLLSKIRLSFYRLSAKFYPWIYKKIYKMDIGEGVKISRKTILDTAINPRGIHIGNDTMLTRGCMVLSHDACRKLKIDTYIGDRCFIGVNAIILPGVRIGNEVIVGAGAVVTKNVQDNCIVAGNPAKIIKENIRCDKYGKVKI